MFAMREVNPKIQVEFNKLCEWMVGTAPIQQRALLVLTPT